MADRLPAARPAPLAGVGIGLRGPHLDEVARRRPAVEWFEVHAENYLGDGPAVRALERLRADYPLSVHAVGLSPGTAGPLDRGHLERVQRLVDRLQPALVSEHLAWSASGGAYLNHLLPLPLTDETLGVVSRHVIEIQDRLGRPILIENPASYLAYRHSTIPEPRFLAALVERTGCRLLCDVNNLYVSAVNLGFDPAAALEAWPAGAVGEIHLAGHAVNDAEGRPVLIDDHGSRVTAAVWALYARAVERFPAAPALVEWDTDLPPLAVLLDEARRAADIRAGAPAGPIHAVLG